MNRQEVVKLFGAVAMLYPRDQAFANADGDMIDVWLSMLSDLPEKAVSASLSLHASKSAYPPSIAELRRGVVELTQPQNTEESAVMAWNRVSYAIRNSGYRASEEFAKLPPICQRLVGSPAQLKEWGLAEDVTVLSVARSQFLKAYETELQRERERAQLPDTIRKLIANASAGMLTEGGATNE